MLSIPSISYGADPELFLTHGGKVIGAEKVVPEAGLGEYDKLVVLDGVQVELHPGNHFCREEFTVSCREAIGTLVGHLRQHPKLQDTKISFEAVVRVGRKELDSLSEKARVLGCQPSFNIYGDHPINVPAGYPIRSAGGHVHMGLDAPIFNHEAIDHRTRMVPMLDIFVGNTCVLIDRDPKARIRRQNYGRAGEYRLPKYGLEYRTLSNFWLRHYVLISLVTGLCRIAGGVIQRTVMRNTEYDQAQDLESEVFKLVDAEKIQRAINRNDVKLAWENWRAIKGFIAKHTVRNSQTGINASNIEEFEFFARKVQEKGLTYWFGDDPVAYWTKPGFRLGRGAERFLSERVRVARKGAAQP